MLFVGDTLVPHDGVWQYYITQARRAAMIRTVELIATLDFDVIVSNSFAAAPFAWLEVDARARKKLCAGVLQRLRA